MSSKTIICLANSRKHNFRCVAGKEYQAHRAVGAWVRPVSAGAERGIPLVDCTYSDNIIAKVSDIIEIPVINADNHLYQSENFVIDSKIYWSKVGEINKNDLRAMVEDPPSLWEVGNSSYSGINDRLHSDLLTRPRQTLYLISPENVRFRVEAEGAHFNDHRKKVRAFFDYKNISYGLSVTDFKIESQYLALNPGSYHNDDVSYFTVSLTELYNGHAYKVVAAVF